MTFRAKPAGSRTRPWEDRERRNMLLNIGFGVIVVASILLLAVAAGISWYGDHLAEAGAVNGKVITKDQFRSRLAVDAFRNEWQERRLRTLLTAGQIRVSDYEARQSLIDQRKQNAAAIALERLIDAEIMGQLALTETLTITDADIDAQFVEEATTPELRHIWVIEVTPETPEGATAPGNAEKAAAKRKAEAALTDLKSGKDWATVARAVSTDDSKDKGGDIGFVDTYAALDVALSDALFAAAKDAPTAVIEGADGIYRIGRVTEIIAPKADATLESQVLDAGLKLEDFRAALRADVTREKLDEAITAPYLVTAPQRRVSQIVLDAGEGEGSEGAIRTRHILYSPDDDPAGAGDLEENDPTWKKAEEEARAAYLKLKADIDQFDALARAASDETSAAITGGKLPYFAPGDSLDEDFAAAIFKEGLKDGQLLEPVRSQFGWHLIQIQHGPTDLQWLTKLREQIATGGISFEDAARDNSDVESAKEGGDMGWVAKGIERQEIEFQIFNTKIGDVSPPLVVVDNGTYLFKVISEETRELDLEQRAKIKQNVFATWYGDKKKTFEIRRDAATATGA